MPFLARTLSKGIKEVVTLEAAALIFNGSLRKASRDDPNYK